MRREPLPVTLVTGFLGAGKTTLVRRLLAAPTGLRIGVILNEFGEAGVDAAPDRVRAYLELGGGCACCVANPDLVAALQELAARDDLDRLLVETSGLADPLPLSWTVGRPDLAEFVRLDAVVTVVDAANHAAAARAEWESQVRGADVVVLTKAALAGAEASQAAETAVRALSPNVRIVESEEISLPALLLDAPDFGRALPDGPAPHAHHSHWDAVTLTVPGPLDRDRVDDLFETLPPGVFRAKGLFRSPTGWVSAHVVAGRVVSEPGVAAPPHGENRFAFFGPDVPRASIEAALARAVRD